LSVKKSAISAIRVKTVSPKTKAVSLMGLAVLIWGLSYPLSRLALKELSPPAFSGLRFLFGALSLLPMALRQRRRPAILAYTGRHSPRLWLWAGLLAGFLLSWGSILQACALTRLPAGQVSFITSLYSSLVPVLALVLGLVPRPKVMAGLGVSLVGLYFLTGGSAAGLGPAAGMVMAANFFWAAHIVVSGHFVAKVNAWLFTFGQILAAGLMMTGAAAAVGLMPTWEIFVKTLPFTMWGILSAGVGYLCLAMAQRELSATAVAVLSPLQCVIAALAGLIFLGEIMTGRMIWGAALIVLGSLLAQAAREAVPLTPDHKNFRFWDRLRRFLGVFCAVAVLALLIWAIAAG
jgi:drug/metabolite transporter (DMT)-like permease